MWTACNIVGKHLPIWIHAWYPLWRSIRLPDRLCLHRLLLENHPALPTHLLLGVFLLCDAGTQISHLSIRFRMMLWQWAISFIIQIQTNILFVASNVTIFCQKTICAWEEWNPGKFTRKELYFNTMKIFVYFLILDNDFLVYRCPLKQCGGLISSLPPKEEQRIVLCPFCHRYICRHCMILPHKTMK